MILVLKRINTVDPMSDQYGHREKSKAKTPTWLGSVDTPEAYRINTLYISCRTSHWVE